MSSKNDDASAMKEPSEAAQAEHRLQVSRLCLFFEVKKGDEYKKVLSFIPAVKGENQNVEAMIYYHGKVPEAVSENSLLRFVGKKDFNIIKKKKASLKAWLATHEFDLLICFAEDRNKYIGKIIRDINARVKVGPNFSGPGRYFDISIGKPGGKMGLDDFYYQVKRYISQLNIN